ncbi:Saccharopine dehydrogenase [Minicystis rosea]|nr:Saccharopine dehydrogenase [Minicystis rosea]
MSAAKEIWILGAAGRCGSAIARSLAERQLSPVLVGRDAARLGELARTMPGEPRTVVAATFEATLEALAHDTPAVVVNTVGPFGTTALPVVRACAKGTHYVDLSNELLGVVDFLALHEEAAAAGKCVVTGAGFGFVATESVVRKLCQGRPTPSRVRVDAVPFIAGGDAVLGDALAASLVDSLAAGGRKYANGKLVRARAGGDAEALTLPDGARVVTGSAPTGDLEAARRASGAPFVVAGSSEIPSTPLTRVVLSILSALASIRPLRDLLVRRLAQVRSPPAKKDGGTSWGHARVAWPDGVAREGWLRTGDGMTFTANVAAEVAARLAQGGHPPGAYTPGALFGAEIAEAAGAEITLDA